MRVLLSGRDRGLARVKRPADLDPGLDTLEAVNPITPWLSEILQRVRDERALVVSASPGAGKTTEVPPALSVDGPVLVLQPRRIAARSIARRIAAQQGWTIGREVGWHVRFERRFSADTQVLLATEGILTARAQSDPLLSGFMTIVLDEFHERSVHADLGIAFARQAWLARPDLRIVVMSATMDTQTVSKYLNDCPVLDVPGTAHPVSIAYQPSATVAGAVRSLIDSAPGQVLCFLPGAAEIRRAAAEIASQVGGGVEVVPLHGSLDGAAQDAAIADAAGRRVVVATNIAETSLTVPGVRAVVDTGVHKVARYDPDRAIDSLTLERISRDAADQRAGRAGRLGAGTVVRLWHSTDRLRPHREPEVHRVDICNALLDILAWGGDPRTFDWFESPSQQTLDAALILLERLGAIAGGRLTETGRQMAALPLHPRLARVMIEARGAYDAAVVCALLSERAFEPSTSATRPTTTNDLSTLLDGGQPLPAPVRRAADAIHALLDRAPCRLTDTELRRALLAGYPDRVARRRAAGSERVLLASGHGAVVGPESGVRDAEYLVALDVTAGRRGDLSEARIRLASAVDRDWLTPTHTEVVHAVHEATGRVRAVERESYEAIVLRERATEPDPDKTQALLVQAWLDRPLAEHDQRLVRRLRFAGLAADLPALVTVAAYGKQSLGDIALETALDFDQRRALDRLAPVTLAVPSGRAVTLDYQEDGSVVAGVKLQEMFGLADTPRIGPRPTPVVLELRAPNGRAVQLTTDLRSFWERTYPEVRRELRGRYPRHPWPEDPWSAVPTARTTRRTG